MWEGIKSLITMLAGMALVMVVISAVFAVFMMPQYGLLWFVDADGADGAPMLLPMVALAALGNLYFKGLAGRFSVIIASLCLVIMANMRGFYWHPFAAGEGFWSLNRTTSFALFAVAFISSEIYRKLAKRFDW